MIEFFVESLLFLFQQSELSLFESFWFTIILEIPRYVLGFVALGIVATVAMRARSAAKPLENNAKGKAPKVSVIVVGLNEVEVLESCVDSLRNQSFNDFEIIVVSDGSTDGMAELATRLRRKGVIDRAVSVNHRGGKSAGINLALRYCTGEIIINVDCDCSYDRHAIAAILEPFNDPQVGAVSGDIVARNGGKNLITRIQHIEYLIAISLGRRFATLTNHVVCVSGAFGAFRRSALDQVGGMDVGGGEDLDLTLRLRQAGWQVRFAPAAICYTDVPEESWTYLRQRLRWERDSVRIRYRKHRHLLFPNDQFSLLEASHQIEFLVFNVFAALVFPIYTIWLFKLYGAFALVILCAYQIGLLIIDTLGLLAAIKVTGRSKDLFLVLYMPAYSVYMSYPMRITRAIAYAHEWLLMGSASDNFVPYKVRSIRKW